MKRRVVVTGMGVVTALACDVSQLWDKIVAGESGVSTLTILDASRFKVRIGGEIVDFDPTPVLDPRDARRLDRFAQFAMVAGHAAVENSGLDFSKEDTFRSGAILGSGIGGLWEIETQMKKLIEKGPDRVSPFTIPKLMLNAAGGQLSIRYGIRGPNYTVATACASATNAMGDALKAIQHEDADIMITGGTESAMTEMGLSGFQNMRALSERNDEPERASRPFDADRDGFVMAEGAGLLIFEELEHAKKRGAEIYAEVLGFGASGDAGHITQPDEQGTGAARAMTNALRDANLNPTDIDYINAHGTSTPLGDKAETRAVKSVFKEHAEKLCLSSTKSQLGHSLGASGGIELVISTEAIRRSVVPPTANLETPDPDCDLDYVPITAREKKLKCCMSNSFGFGGHNASIVIGASQG